jgi:hypothetical protein
MEDKRMKELYEEFKSYVPNMVEYLEHCYKGQEELFPSVTKWIEKVLNVNNTSRSKLLLPLGLNEKYIFWDSYFYLILKSESYLYEFADLGLTDLKNFIKENYSECLTSKAFKGLSSIFRKRREILDIVFLQEYSGKNRSRETLKKEDKFISDREIYYLNPLIDDLWDTHGYGALNSNSLVGTRLINIRGTNGSGKTTMVKRIIAELNKHEEPVWDEFTTEEITTYHKVYTRKIQVWNKQKFIVMGIYNEKQTGGVDNYDTPWQVMYALFHFCKKYKGYTILFEGVRISTDYKYWWKVFSMLLNVGVRTDIVGLMPSDVQWAVNNVIERRKNKGLWELRHPEDIANNNYEILRGLLMFLSEGFNPYIIKGDKMASIDETFELLRSFINLEMVETIPREV